MYTTLLQTILSCTPLRQGRNPSLVAEVAPDHLKTILLSKSFKDTAISFFYGLLFYLTLGFAHLFLLYSLSFSFLYTDFLAVCFLVQEPILDMSSTASPVAPWTRCCTYDGTLHNEVHRHEQRCGGCDAINPNLDPPSQSASRGDLFLQSVSRRHSQAKNRSNIISSKYPKNLKKFQKL